MSGNRFIRSVLVTLGALVCAAAATGSATAAPPEILVLSNRADLITGGDALVEIKWPAGTNTNDAQVGLNGVNVKSAFATRDGDRSADHHHQPPDHRTDRVRAAHHSLRVPPGREQPRRHGRRRVLGVD